MSLDNEQIDRKKLNLTLKSKRFRNLVNRCEIDFDGLSSGAKEFYINGAKELNIPLKDFMILIYVGRALSLNSSEMISKLGLSQW